MIVGDPVVIRPGWAVHSADGVKLGEVKQTFGTYLLVGGGLTLRHDLHVPVSFIALVEDGRVRLSVSAERLADLGWERPPSRTVVPVGAAGCASAGLSSAPRGRSPPRPAVTRRQDRAR